VSTKAPEKPPARAPRGAKQPIDPRIRARRIEVQRSEGRRRLQRLALVGAAVALVAGLWWLAFTPLFDVDAIRVHGADHTGEAAVLSSIGIHRGDALFTADVGAASRSLARLPWVATVKVRRSWPGTISVTIVERAPVAAIEAKCG
jgi:cell division protein FtsQ